MGRKKKGQQPGRMRLFTTRYYAEKSLQGAENSWRNKKKYTSEIFFLGREANKTTAPLVSRWPFPKLFFLKQKKNKEIPALFHT
jgi:hypothetical protein